MKEQLRESPPLSSQAAFVFIGKASAFLFAFVTPMLLVRIFSREEYGIYQQALLVSLTLVDVLKWGLINSLFYFFPLAKDRLKELLSQTFFFLVSVGLVFLPMVYLLRYSIAAFFKSDTFIELIWPIMVYFFFMLISLILNVIFILEKKSRTVVIYEILNQLIRVSLIVSISLIFRDIVLTVWGLALFAVLRSLFLYIYLRRGYTISPKWIDRTLLKEQLKYCFPIGSARLVGEVGRRIDKYILSAALSPASYAIYMIANIKIPFMRLMYESIGNVVIPKMTEHSAADQIDETKELWHKMIVKFAAVTIPVVVFFYFLAEEVIVLLYTSKYIESVDIFRVFLLLSFQQMINPSVVLRSCNDTATIFKTHLFSTIFAIILCLVLIKAVGMIGAAAAMVSAAYLRMLLRLDKVRKIFHTRINDFLPWKDLGKITLYSSICGLFLYGLQQWELPAIPKVVASGTVYFSIIAGITLYFKYFEWKQVKETIKGFVRPR
jgi:O-antigen/teichoic acid export membrane protein